MRILLALSILAASWFGAAGAQTSEPDYLIRPGDTLDISVLEDPGLNRQVLVRPDGKISLPLAGTLEAEGLTPERLQADISRRLAKDFVTAPTVSVALTSFNRDEDLAQIFIIGAVNSPGRYEVELPIDVLEALALAGGPGVFAARTRIQVRRRGNLGDQILTFNYETIENGLVPSAAIDLADRDVIVVPERGLFE